MFPPLTQVMHWWQEGSELTIVVPSVRFFDKVGSGCSRSTKKGHHYLLVREGLPSQFTGVQVPKPQQQG